MKNKELKKLYVALIKENTSSHCIKLSKNSSLIITYKDKFQKFLHLLFKQLSFIPDLAYQPICFLSFIDSAEPDTDHDAVPPSSICVCMELQTIYIGRLAYIKNTIYMFSD